MDIVPARLCQLLCVFLFCVFATGKADKYNCDGQMTSSLPQSHFSSSSELSSSHSAGFARLNRRDGAGGWSPLISNKYQWLQIDLGERSEITGVATQGKYGSSDWVTSYLLMFSDTGRNWKQYHQEESISSSLNVLCRQVNFSVDKHVHHFLYEGDIYHLDIDYELSFGCIPITGKSVSLLQKNFHGYKPQIYIVGNVSYSCLEPELTPVTFINSNSYLVLPGTLEQDELTVSFQFRTWNKEGILFSYKLSPEALELALYIADGKFKMSLFKHGRVHSNIATGFKMNNGHWHSVNLMAKRNRVSVSLDDQGPFSLQTTLPIQVSPEENYYFAGCPDNITDNGCFSPVKSFLGCMKSISIGSNLINLISVQQGWYGNFSDLQFDLCGIIDRCLPNYCEHRGQCSQTWNDFYCNCSDTGYMGATCHYPIYEQSCEAYKHRGNTSGYFLIDTDGSGPLEPFNVYCNISETVITVINHNNTDLSKIKNSNKENPHVMNFKYFADLEQLVATIDNAENCKQELAYHCKKSRILQNQNRIPYSWWIGRTNETQTYWSGSSPDVYKCTCGLEGNCIDSQHYCNCDADKSEWSNDTGSLSYKDHLPVMKIVITDTNRPNSEVAYKLGPLLCSGDRSFWNSASFNTVSSYLHFPTLHGEISADVSFFFKTTSHSGLFLENLGIKDFIRIELQSPTEVMFSFDVGNGPVEITVQSPTNLNDNQWHFVKAERNIKEANLQVDQLPQKTHISSSDGHIRLQLNSQLYIGGTASRQRGFLGCLRSLKLNGIALDLEERAKMTPGIKPGCPGHCSSYGNLCQNGGKCKEKHNGFSCDCNSSAYGGPFCKKEMSAYFGARSSLTFNFYENSTGFKNTSVHPSVLYTETNNRESIAFSFRTTQSPSLLLFVSSFNKQYISIIISKNGSLQIQYKLQRHLDPEIFSVNVKNLADGQLQKVRILRKEESLFVEVNQHAPVKFSLALGTEFHAIQLLVLGKISVENIDADLETTKANAHGFIGCLSSVHFNHIFPLRTFLQHNSPQVTIKGHIIESSCGSLNGISSTSSETTHTFADHLGPKDNHVPIANAIKNDTALIGGVISVVAFILLCIAAIAIRIYLQKNSYKKEETKVTENEDNAATAAALKTDISMQNATES
ncbi:hypothetical protein GDO86_001514 [Hymenochirus boettgeri]|uniref:Contactin-associated protein-like 4 n=1 Tax=Hymenochirus boettgeri TaxID=247094 RepID=A0A8T2KIK0_9PIPI|nr:hypothetical protein GDO86_001514 [Hymenochirus boettgeri]